MTKKKAKEETPKTEVQTVTRDEDRDDLPMNEDGTKRVYSDGETWLDIQVKDAVDFGMVAGGKA